MEMSNIINPTNKFNKLFGYCQRWRGNAGHFNRGIQETLQQRNYVPCKVKTESCSNWL